MPRAMCRMKGNYFGRVPYNKILKYRHSLKWLKKNNINKKLVNISAFNISAFNIYKNVNLINMLKHVNCI